LVDPRWCRETQTQALHRRIILLAEAAECDSHPVRTDHAVHEPVFVLIMIATTRPKLNVKAGLVPAMMVIGACDAGANAPFAPATTGALLMVVSAGPTPPGVGER
jgi:hypothetical protein